jgi:hypothetical protein
MTSRDFSSLTDAELIGTYRTAARVHLAHSAVGAYKKANPEAEIIAACYRELRGRGPRSQATLLTLLDDDDAAVRAWAASHALEFAPDLAEPVLIELEQGGSLAAFSARMTLREWRAGRLVFP